MNNERVRISALRRALERIVNRGSDFDHAMAAGALVYIASRALAADDHMQKAPAEEKAE
jgi:hypothetical protein